MQRRHLLSLAGAAVLAAPADPVRARSGFRSSRIEVSVRGRGSDVVLIPGLASTPGIWRDLAGRLSGRRRLHLVAIRGFGTLSAGANGRGVLMRPLAEEIARYCREQGLRRPAVVGHSMGGQIALRLAADDPGLVDRVMAVDASPFFPALIEAAATAAEIEPIAQLAYQAVLLLGDEALRRGGRGLDMDEAAEAVFQTLGWQGGDRQVLAQGLYEVMTTDLRPRLPGISAPVTVVYGATRDDRSPRYQLGGRMRGAYAGLRRPARFEAIDGAEHMVMIDRPGPFADAVARFLD